MLMMYETGCRVGERKAGIFEHEARAGSVCCGMRQAQDDMRQR